MFKNKKRIQAIRDFTGITPDITVLDAWFPLGMDSEEFKRGARWSEAFWRSQIRRILDE